MNGNGHLLCIIYLCCSSLSLSPRSVFLLQDLYLVTMKLVAKKVPRLSVAYLNASEIFENNRAGIQRMKHLFGRSISSVENGQLFRTNNEEKKEVIWSEKYRHDLFYILPYYHRELPLHVKKLIVLDADLEFRTDILDLYRQFRCQQNFAVVFAVFEESTSTSAKCFESVRY